MIDYEWNVIKDKRRKELLTKRTVNGLKLSEWEELGSLNTALAVYQMQLKSAEIAKEENEYAI
jgi:hypothetical protein